MKTFWVSVISCSSCTTVVVFCEGFKAFLAGVVFVFVWWVVCVVVEAVSSVIWAWAVLSVVFAGWCFFGEAFGAEV